jgi:hypothetical protein
MDQAAHNRREFFRLRFDDLTGTMQVFEVNEEPVVTEPQPIQIVNVGGGGLYMRTDADLPTEGVYATFTFTILGQRFTFRGHAKRKQDDSTTRGYAVEFVDVEEADRSALVSLLGRAQVAQRYRRSV